MGNDLTYWTEALAGAAPAVHSDTPHAGYYKMRRHKDGPLLPVVIYEKDGELVALVGAKKAWRSPSDVWTYVAANPVTKEAAMHAFANGDQWPGDAPEVPGIGDNSGDISLAEQIHEYASMALRWLGRDGIKDSTTKDKAANMRAELLKLSKQADDERAAKKRPHDDAAKAVQAEYKPLIDEADAAAAELRNALTAYMREEERREKEAREKAWREEQERVAAERKRIEDERAAKLRDDPVAALTEPEPELPVATPPPEPVKVQAGGQRGRKTGLRTVTVYEVTDYAAALAHCKDHPDVREAVEKVCRAQAKAGAVVPGVTAREEKVAA